MLFNSYGFLVFFAVILAIHYSPISWTFKKVSLLMGSYLFYALWNPPFVFLLWLSTVIDWWVSQRLDLEERRGRRRVLLGISLGANLGLLGFFKYGGFILENFTALVHAMGFQYTPAAPDIILPVGISFYTFQTLSYTFDVYRRKSKPAESFLNFALFVTFFPQLVAGPIVRPDQLIPQFRRPHYATRNMFFWGLFLVTLGLFQKVALADGLLSAAADAVYGSDVRVNFVDAWVGTLAFAGQIFCDFAGYSTTAIGIGLCLGFSLPTNFLFPYAAIGFSDFWRRWHISLSTWLRDYLYISLGGNRRGHIRTYVNLMLTMLLGGLWHGASWNFVIWGGIHGLYLIVERLLRRYLGDGTWLHHGFVRFCMGTLTFLLVTLTWVFFRAQDLPTAWALIQEMLLLTRNGEVVLDLTNGPFVLVVMIPLLITQWRLRHTTLEDALGNKPWWLVALLWVGMIVSLLLVQGGENAFIYFQF